MISFSSLYFFVYCPSRIEVDFMSIFSTSCEFNFPPSLRLKVDLTTFKVGVESDYIGTGDSHNSTPSQRHRTIMPLPNSPNGNRIRVSYGYSYSRGSGCQGRVPKCLFLFRLYVNDKRYSRWFIQVWPVTLASMSWQYRQSVWEMAPCLPLSIAMRKNFFIKKKTIATIMYR